MIYDNGYEVQKDKYVIDSEEESQQSSASGLSEASNFKYTKDSRGFERTKEGHQS